MTEAVVQSCSVKRPATLLKKRLWHRCFPKNFVRFLRAPIFTEHLWWLLLQWLSLIRKNRKNALINTHSPFYIEKFAFISCLNLKCMLTNSGIATIFTDLYILLFVLTLKATQRLMREITFIVHVSERNDADACVSRIMRETW